MQKDEGGITAMKQTPVPYPQAPLCLKILIAFLWAWAAAGALELIRPFSFPAVATLFLLGGMLLIRRRMIRLVFLLISVVALFYGTVNMWPSNLSGTLTNMTSTSREEGKLARIVRQICKTIQYSGLDILQLQRRPSMTCLLITFVLLPC